MRKKIIDLIFSTLRGLADKGIEEDMVKASVNTVDFKLREANFGGFPKGIVYNIQSLASWLYDADPLMPLKYDELMKKIKVESGKGYFEKLIKTFLLENNHQSIIVLVPKQGLAEEQAAKVREKLAQFKSTLDKKSLDDLVEKTKALQEMQVKPDDPEALASLPTLELSEVNRETPVFPLDVKKESSPKILFHDLFTNKIAYTQVGFNAHAIPIELVQYLPLFGKLILEMGTHKSDYVRIAQQIGIRTGGIGGSHYSATPLNDRETVISWIMFRGVALVEKVGELYDLYAELLGEYSFDNHKRLTEIIKSSKADMEASIVPGGNHYVVSRLQSYYSRLGKYDELTGGITYYKFLEQLQKRALKDPAEVADKFTQVADILFSKDNLLVNLTSEAEDYAVLEEKSLKLAEMFPASSRGPAALDFDAVQVNEAFPTASTVQYVGKGANLYDLGFTYSGRFNVLKSILRMGYLWDRVRVQGGAYGSSLSLDPFTGDFSMVSYRDPNLTETLAVYDEISDFLNNLNLSGKEFEKILIGCVGQLDPPLTPDRKGSISMAETLTRVTHEFKQKVREELLSTKLEDVKEFAGLFQKIKETGAVCVLGNEEKIKNNKQVFDHMVKVFE